MKKQRDEILKKDWDVLIILDACRYDFFKDIYLNYLDGDLEKIKSAGNNTQDYFRNIFWGEDFKDTVYVSSIPWINSLGIGPLSAEKFFWKIIDAWETGWDENLGTVPPAKLTDISKKVISKHLDKKIIIHYLQPHEPYLTFEEFTNIKRKESASGFLSRGDNEFAKFIQNLEALMKPIRGVQYRIFQLFQRLIGENKMLNLLDRLGIVTSGPGMLGMILGEEGIKKLYGENLGFVLKEVKKLSRFLQDLSKKTIITADHGELLGENKEFGHPQAAWTEQKIERMEHTNHSKLLTVPWLKLKNS